MKQYQPKIAPVELIYNETHALGNPSIHTSEEDETNGPIRVAPRKMGIHPLRVMVVSSLPLTGRRPGEECMADVEDYMRTLSSAFHGDQLDAEVQDSS